MGPTTGQRAITSIAELLSPEGVTLHFPQADLGPYRLQRVKTSQCKVACPLGTDVKGYVGLIAAGKFQKSLQLIRETNPFPAICGRVCMHPCEPECRRGEVDAPVAIRALKRFVADGELQAPVEPSVRPAGAKTAGKVAVVGSGPAGLTAANDLARWGFDVTVFEALPVAGGMLTVGIPPFRLPRDVIGLEIAAIAAQGVDIRTNRRIGDPGRLLHRGYGAVFVATGAHRGLKMGIPGEDLRGCLDALSFLKGVHLGDGGKPGDRVVVIGAGYAALDAARTAVRLGAHQVDLVYRRSREELPYPDMAAQARREGVTIHYHLEPLRVLGRGGKVRGLVCRRLRSAAPDRVGRRQPVAVKNSRQVLKADAVIFGIHQEPDLSFLPRRHRFEVSRWNHLVVDPETLATSQEGIFAGGDVVSGPKSVIEAIAMGHQAAASIRGYLGGAGRDEAAAGRDEDIPGRAARQSEIIIEDWVPQEKARLRIRRVRTPSWEGRFEETTLEPSEKAAVREAQRCLMCGPCQECVECIATCEKKLMAVSVPGADMGEALVRIPWISGRFPEDHGPWEMLIEQPDGQTVTAQASAVICQVWEELCRGCAECVQACPYEARHMVPRGDEMVISQVDASLCRGCGVCAAVCPTGASVMGHFTEQHLVGQLDRLWPSSAARRRRGRNAEPRLVAFACHWSVYPLLQDGKIKVAADLRPIRVMCLSSVHPGLILRAFEVGADGVLLLGCAPHRCHYGAGTEISQSQLNTAHRLMNTLGIERRRVRLETAAPDESGRLARMVRRFARSIAKLGPSPLAG
jgi:NADPH-dependent glutamate synthase beta subunit-like oxidoreductase/coenzyme F420-reducing hydrogenase delta subunit/ferredoxin